MTPLGTYTGYDVVCDMTTAGGGWLVSSIISHKKETTVLRACVLVCACVYAVHMCMTLYLSMKMLYGCQ